jgi:Carboxypeptidase regulatory-like domain
MRKAMGCVVMAVVGLAVVVGVAYAEDEPTSALSFVVLKDYNGKPIRNAAVVLHPVNPHGKQRRGGFELKTDGEGKTHFEGVPYGKMRVQVLAPGFQTFGEDYDIQSPTLEITVKLKSPQGQYSIYSDHPDQSKPDDSKKDTPPDKK